MKISKFYLVFLLKFRTYWQNLNEKWEITLIKKANKSSNSNQMFDLSRIGASEETI